MSKFSASSRLNQSIPGSRAWVYPTSKPEDREKGMYWGTAWTPSWDSGNVYGDSEDDVCSQIETLYEQWKEQRPTR